MRNQEWDSALAQLYTLDLRQLVFRLFCRDTVDGESALGVVDKSEILAGLLDRDNILEARGVVGVSADFAVDLDEALHHDGFGFARVERILESVEVAIVSDLSFHQKKIFVHSCYLPVADEDDQGHAIAELVRARRRFGSVGTCEWISVECQRVGASYVPLSLSS